MINRRQLSTFVILQSLIVIAFSGCKSPFDRTRDATGSSGTGVITGGASLVVFSSELKTGGGAFEYPGGENQALAFNDLSNPVSARSIRYVWNGQDVAAQHIFAGFDLMHTQTEATYASTPGRDLRGANYTHVTFFARGSLDANTFVKVEVSDDGNTSTPAPCVALSADGSLDAPFGQNPCGVKEVMGTSWGPAHSIPISNSNLNPLKDFFKATFIYLPPGGTPNPGNGGTVYFDKIEYAP